MMFHDLHPSETTALVIFGVLMVIALGLYLLNRRLVARERAQTSYRRAERLMARADEDPATALSVRDEREILNAQELQRRAES